MRQLKSRIEAVTYLVLIALMFATVVFPASAKEGIYIVGINPQSASSGDHVVVYGGGATPGGLVVANLTGPSLDFVKQVYLNNSLVYVGPNNSNFTLLYPGNFSIIYKEYFENDTFGYGNLGNLTLGVIPAAQVGTTLGQTYAGSDGGWRIDFVAPQLFSGNYSVTVVDSTTLTSATVGLQLLGTLYVFPLNNTLSYLNVTVVNTGTPFLIDSISPISGPAGTLVTINGHGASGRIAVSFNGSQVFYSSVYFYDYWSVSFQAPQVSSGTYSIVVTDVSTERMAFTWFTITPSSTIVRTNLASVLLPGNILIYAAGLTVVSGAATFMLIVEAERIRRRRSCSP